MAAWCDLFFKVSKVAARVDVEKYSLERIRINDEHLVSRTSEVLGKNRVYNL